LYVDNKDELDAFIRIGRGSGSNHKNENKGYLKLMIFKRPDYKASTNKNVVAKAAKEEAEQNIGPFLDQVEETKRWFIFPDSFAVEKCRTFISQGHLPDWYVEESQKLFNDNLLTLEPEYQRASDDRKKAIARIFLETIESKGGFRIVDFQMVQDKKTKQPQKDFFVLGSDAGLQKCCDALESSSRPKESNSTMLIQGETYN
jgi:hypothetical protein